MFVVIKKKLNGMTNRKSGGIDGVSRERTEEEETTTHKRETGRYEKKIGGAR